MHPIVPPRLLPSGRLARPRGPLLIAALGLLLPVRPAAQTGASAGSGVQGIRALPLDLVATIDLPAADLDALFKEDVEREAQGLPPRFATTHACALTPLDAGTWEDLADGLLLWRLRIRAPGARSLNLGFGHYRMTPGGRLSVHSADLTHVVRSFTRADNEAHGELWTPVVQCDDLVLELEIPASELDGLLLELSSIHPGYRGFGVGATALLSGSCNVDVVCPEGIPWALEIPSVGVISTGGSTFCTGFLVNNVRRDLKPYFMTANHCGIGAGNAASLVVYWNYQNSTCRPPGSPASGGSGDGTLAQFNTGSFFRASSSPSDFTLVELDDPIDPGFQLSWAGWNATGSTGSAAIGIHHPNTDEKRISFEDDPTSTTSYLQNTVPGDGTHVRITDWDLGTTEPGSSGSPLFDPQHHVIGQLHGGFASCTSQTSDWYGKFSVSWTGGGTNSTRLVNWLDPDGTGTLVLDTDSLDTLCSDAGTIELDRASYPCSGTALVTVVDCGLNTSGNSAESVLVGVRSDSEPGGEALLLTETGPNTSRFEGTLALAGVDAAGVLLVSAGDLVTAEYLDADDGGGGMNVLVSDSAPVDCQPPMVLSVVFSNVTATSVHLTVSADEPITADALVGLVCGMPSASAGSESPASVAEIELTGLFPNTTYAVSVEARDEAGNLTIDDNGGACHTVTTANAPNAFTEEFLGDNDLDGLQFLFRPTAGLDGYELCKRGVAGFPTDPSGGSTIVSTDDGSGFVSVGGSDTVKLYGTAYASFWVNANGNLTFGASDSTFTESLAEHFSLPRVAALFDDLNPSAGGSVTRKRLDDRIAVTFQNVPEYNQSNQNSFQFELFFDGRIRVTYLGIAATDGIAGLSRGAGVPVQFVETDLSNAPPCVAGGPRGRPGAPISGSFQVAH